jgi:hypothetical protein
MLYLGTAVKRQTKVLDLPKKKLRSGGGLRKKPIIDFG